VNGNRAIIKQSVKFYYGFLWSLKESWGGELPPRKGDMAIVNKGDTLIIDESAGSE